MIDWKPMSEVPVGQSVLLWVDPQRGDNRAHAVVGYVRDEYGEHYAYSAETGHSVVWVTRWAEIQPPGCIPVVSTEPADAAN